MKRKLPEILNETEEKLLLKQFNKRYWTSYRNSLMVQLSLTTGLRISEVLNLKWGNIEFSDHGRTRISEGKGKKDRTVFIKAYLLDEMINYSDKFFITRGSEYFVFCTGKGDRIKDSYIRRMINIKIRKADIEKNIHFHSLRHTALTRLYDKTKDTRLVQEVAGHSDISTTMIYYDKLNIMESKYVNTMY